MKIVLDKWQEEILDCKAKYILLCKGRQIGGTLIMSRKCAMRLVSQKGCQIVVVSLTEDQAHLVIVMALAYLETNYKSWIKEPYSRNVTKSSINLTNGSTIISRPVGTTGNAVRGFTGHVLYINEASRMPEVVFEAAKPILLTTDGEIWMDSTPFGVEGYFYQSWLNKNNRFKVFYHTSEEVIKNRKLSVSWTITQRESAIQFLKEEEEDMTKLQYQQEYLGMFVGGIQRFIPDDIVDQLCTEKPFEYKPQSDKFQGIDIARMGGDDTVMLSMDRIARERLIQFDLEIPEAQKLTDTARLIILKDKTINHKKIYMDDGGLGVGVYDILFEDPQTKRKVIALNNAHRSIDIEPGKDRPRGKSLLGVDMSINFKVLAENGKIKLFDDPRIRQSLRSMQYDNSEGTLKIYGNDSHIFEALKRAVWCMKDKSLKIWVKWSSYKEPGKVY